MFKKLFLLYFFHYNLLDTAKAAEPEKQKVAEPVKEASYLDLKLASFDAAKKLALIKEIRTYMNLGLKEVKLF